MEPLNLTQAFSSFSDHWQPHVAAKVDGHLVKIAKVEGEFVWHHHETDELFLVHRGELELRFRDRDTVRLGPGELYVVPARVEHQPVADEECEILMFEREDVVNTGNAGGERTREPRALTSDDR